MAITLTINPANNADFVGATTANTVAVDAVFRGLPNQDLWAVFDPANFIATPDRVFIPQAQIVGGVFVIPIQVEPIEGTQTVTAHITNILNVTLATVSDTIELDLPDFTFVINGGSPTTSTTFITLTVGNIPTIPPGRILWIICNGSQVYADRFCFDNSQVIGGEVSIPVQLVGATNGIRTVSLLIYHDNPYVFWGSVSDTIDLQLPPMLQPIATINPLDGYPSGESYTRFNDGYIRIDNLAINEPAYITLGGGLLSPQGTLIFETYDTYGGFIDIDVVMTPGANAGDGYQDGYRTIGAFVRNIEQQESYTYDDILLDTTPPIIAFIPNFDDSVLAGIPSSIEIVTNEPANLFFSTDGYEVDLDSYTTSIELSVNPELTSITIRAIAIDFAGNISAEAVQEFLLSTSGYRGSRFGLIGQDAYLDNRQILSDTDNIGQSDPGIADRPTRPQDDFIQEVPRTIAEPYFDTPSLLDDPTLETLKINFAQHINTFAKVFEIDTRLPMPVKIILRPHATLRDSNRGGFSNSNISELAPYSSGSYVTSYNDYGRGLRHSMYYDNNSGQWIRNTTTLQQPAPLPARLFDGYTGRSQYVYSWVPHKPAYF